MGKATSDRPAPPLTCQICSRPYSPTCDYRQGRCPYHPPLIDLQRLKERFMKQPDPRRHFQLSMIKSSIRIVAGGALCLLGNTWLIVAGVALILGELVGIAEEMV